MYEAFQDIWDGNDSRLTFIDKSHKVKLDF